MTTPAAVWPRLRICRRRGVWGSGNRDARGGGVSRCLPADVYSGPVKTDRDRSLQLSGRADGGVVRLLSLLVQVFSTDQRKTVAGVSVDFDRGKCTGRFIRKTSRGCPGSDVPWSGGTAVWVQRRVGRQSRRAGPRASGVLATSRSRCPSLPPRFLLHRHEHDGGRFGNVEHLSCRGPAAGGGIHARHGQVVRGLITRERKRPSGIAVRSRRFLTVLSLRHVDSIPHDVTVGSVGVAVRAPSS